MAGARLMSDSGTSPQGSFPGHAGLASAHVPDPAPPHSFDVEPSPAPAGPSRGKIWMHRLLVLLFVFVCAAAGVLLVVLPWTRQWTDNAYLLRYPQLRSIVTRGFFRGLCSGLGLLDIWIGFFEAVHYHEDKIV
jgi:hypothetical protein